MNKSTLIQFRLTKDEKEMIEQEAKKRGMSMSVYVRYAIYELSKEK